MSLLTLIVTVYENQEKPISLKEVKRPLNLMVLIRKMKLIVRFFSISFPCLGHLYYLSLVITTFQAVTFFHIFKFVNLYVTCFIVTYYLALSLSLLLLYIFSLVISYFPYFKFATFQTRVILCNTLKKEGRAFRNIRKYIPILCNQPC